MTQPPNDGPAQSPGAQPSPPDPIPPPLPDQPAPPPLPDQPAPPPLPDQPALPPYGPVSQPVPGQFPGQPTSAQPSPGSAEFGQPGYPPGQPGYPPYSAPPPKKKRGLLIASIVLAVVLLLCAIGGVGAFLVLRNIEDGEGAAEPVAAVESFLKAVYTDKDAKKAAGLVCKAARDDEAIAKKVKEIEEYATLYQTPRFKWETPKVDDQNGERAIVSVALTMITGDEKTSAQQLKITVVQKTGWWVCDVAG